MCIAIGRVDNWFPQDAGETGDQKKNHAKCNKIKHIVFVCCLIEFFFLAGKRVFRESGCVAKPLGGSLFATGKLMAHAKTAPQKHHL